MRALHRQIAMVIREKREGRAFEILDALLSEEPFALGECQFYPMRKALRFRGQVVQMTPRQFELCLLLAIRPGMTFSRHQIMDFCGCPEDMDDRSIDSMVKRIRRAFEAVPGEPFNPIQTIYGVGYHWNEDLPDVT